MLLRWRWRWRLLRCAAVGYDNNNNNTITFHINNQWSYHLSFHLHHHHPHHRHYHTNSNANTYSSNIIKDLCLSGNLLAAVRVLCSCPCNVMINSQIYSLVLQEIINRKESLLGRRIHAQIITTGFKPNHYLNTKLLIFYAKSGYLDSARYLFDEISLTLASASSTIVPWNALISGYSRSKLDHHQQHALDLYYSMRSAALAPDHFTFVSVFRCCSVLAKLDHGQRAHCILIKTPDPEIKANVLVNTSLVDMYCKCSCPCDARQAFNRAPERNVVTWTALISGYGQHGKVVEVIELFHRMIHLGYRPNSITYLALLSACSHGGLVSAGWKYFRSMTQDYGITPKGEHYAAVVDMLGRAGRLDEAYELVLRSPCNKDHSVLWGALLGACRIHGDANLGKLAAKRLFKMQPENIGKHIVLSNTYAALDMWDKVANVRQRLGKLGFKKEPASSSIEIRGQVRTFLVGDKSHGDSEMVYETITGLSYTLIEAANVLV